MTAAAATAPARGRRSGEEEIPRRSSEPFVVELERFRGPLDLLLHLIRSQDIDIFDIPIARITRQFRDALEEGLDRLELDRAGEFLEMASTLVRIKSRMLLPRNQEVDWEEDPRADLVRRLLEYEHFQEVAQVLSSAEADRSRHFPKGFIPPRPDPSPSTEELEVDREDFLAAALDVPEPIPEARHQAPSREVTVREKIRLLQDLLRRAGRLVYRKLFEGEESRLHAVTALLACLEMARRQVVRIRQTGPFGEVWIHRGPAFDPDAEPDDGEGDEEEPWPGAGEGSK